MATRRMAPAMHMTGAQRKWKRIRRWSHLLPLLVFCRAFVSPVTRRAEKEAMEANEVVDVGPPASLEAGTLEVVGENTSAPVRLLYSTGRGRV